MLGKHIALELGKTCDVYGCDIRGKQNVLKNFKSIDLVGNNDILEYLDEVQPDVICHTAAIVDVNRCENEKSLAFQLHVEASRNIAESCKCLFIYISTDSVFNGIRGNYSEVDHPDPINYYALTKLQGENAILAANSLSLVIRTNMFGYASASGKSLAEWALTNLRNGHKISGYDDVRFNPLYTRQFARIISTLIHLQRTPVGILNVASAFTISKYEFIKTICATFGYSPDLVQRTKLVETGAPRPRNTYLNIDKLKALIGNVPTAYDGVLEMRKDLGGHDQDN